MVIMIEWQSQLVGSRRLMGVGQGYLNCFNYLE